VHCKPPQPTPLFGFNGLSQSTCCPSNSNPRNPVDFASILCAGFAQVFTGTLISGVFVPPLTHSPPHFLAQTPHQSSAAQPESLPQSQTACVEKGVRHGGRSVYRHPAAAPLVLLAGAAGTHFIPPHFGSVAPRFTPVGHRKQILSVLFTTRGAAALAVGNWSIELRSVGCSTARE
jgi:hypothetical protein